MSNGERKAGVWENGRRLRWEDNNKETGDE